MAIRECQVTFVQQRGWAACMLASNNKTYYEEDHLISLENGGDPRNVWPEPYKTQIDGQTVGARRKNTVENYIHNAICFDVPGPKSHGTAADASMTLRRGQEILASDWCACRDDQARSRLQLTIVCCSLAGHALRSKLFRTLAFP